MQDFELNKLQFGPDGSPSGVIAIHKPIGVTSHDVVYKVRKLLHTRKVGHAGTLDPFADGVLIVLVGKATKLSDQFLLKSKSYRAQVLFGIQTDSGDREGNILKLDSATPDLTHLASVLTTFQPSYTQFVPVFSSVKVAGEKLRNIARKSDSWHLEATPDSRKLVFRKGGITHSLDIPQHESQIFEIAIVHQAELDIADSEFAHAHRELLSSTQFAVATIDVTCSKGTYIRTLAEDIGARLTPPVPAMLWSLTRTASGDIKLADSIGWENLHLWATMIQQPQPETHKS